MNDDLVEALLDDELSKEDARRLVRSELNWHFTRKEAKIGDYFVKVRYSYEGEEASYSVTKGDDNFLPVLKGMAADDAVADFFVTELRNEYIVGRWRRKDSHCWVRVDKSAMIVLDDSGEYLWRHGASRTNGKCATLTDAMRWCDRIIDWTKE